LSHFGNERMFINMAVLPAMALRHFPYLHRSMLSGSGQSLRLPSIS